MVRTVSWIQDNYPQGLDLPETIRNFIQDAAAKWGTADIHIPVRRADMLTDHVKNFLECVQSRKKPNLDVETGAKLANLDRPKKGGSYTTSWSPSGRYLAACEGGGAIAIWWPGKALL